jgi:hypothetical protein
MAKLRDAKRNICFDRIAAPMTESRFAVQVVDEELRLGKPETGFRA